MPARVSEAEERDFFKKMVGAMPLAPGEADYHVIDGYEVVCGGVPYFLHFDMYHCSQPSSSEPPIGFTLRQL